VPMARARSGAGDARRPNGATIRMADPGRPRVLAARVRATGDGHARRLRRAGRRRRSPT
jgi:hypothetical protein